MAHALGLLILIAAVVTLHQPAQAQQPIPAASCPHLFKANGQGSSSYIEYCVSDNGNITNFKTPFNVPQIGLDEGYGLCQESPIAAYYDFSSRESGNWGTSQILSVSGSSIKIKRSTGDGNWTLVQTISKVATIGAIKIVMALTNNQAVERVAYLQRWVFPEASRLHPSSVGASRNGAWFWENSPNTFHDGLQLQNAGKPPFPYRQGFVGPFTPNPCDFAANTHPLGVLALGLGSPISYVYAGAVPAGATRIVTLNYRGA